jgi:stress-induced-phosphoprotein 1
MSADECKQRGNDAFNAGRFEDAIAEYTRAIELRPRDHILFSNRSAAYAALKTILQGHQSDACELISPTDEGA